MYGTPLDRGKSATEIPTTPFSLVLCNEYFDWPQRDSHSVHYI
jgi:hypothetical protein